jgi:hypothetical protein
MTGYQRLLTFESSSGGFEWWGKDPGHIVLSAYGIMEFTDMSKVIPIDASVIDRTLAWLEKKQAENGSWPVEKGRSAWSVSIAGDYQQTAYVTWALAEAGAGRRPSVMKALTWLRENSEASADDPYASALVANAELAIDGGSALGNAIVEGLLTRRGVDGLWRTGMTATGSHGAGAAVEVTALMADALRRAGESGLADETRMALLANRKSNGTFGSTQATVLALRAIVLGSTPPPTEPSTVTVSCGDRKQTFVVGVGRATTHEVDFSEGLGAGAHPISVTIDGPLVPAIQVAASWYEPWDKVAPEAPDRLDIQVAMPSAPLSAGDAVSVGVVVSNRTGEQMTMVTAEIGLPACAVVDIAALKMSAGRRNISKVETGDRRVVLYFDVLEANTAVDLEIPLIAAVAARTTSPSSLVYEYYAPDSRCEARPVVMKAE